MMIERLLQKARNINEKSVSDPYKAYPDGAVVFLLKGAADRIGELERHVVTAEAECDRLHKTAAELVERGVAEIGELRADLKLKDVALKAAKGRIEELGEELRLKVFFLAEAKNALMASERERELLSRAMGGVPEPEDDELAEPEDDGGPTVDVASLLDRVARVELTAQEAADGYALGLPEVVRDVEEADRRLKLVESRLAEDALYWGGLNELEHRVSALEQAAVRQVAG